MMNLRKFNNKKIIVSVLSAYSIIHPRYSGDLKKGNGMRCLTLRSVLKNRYVVYICILYSEMGVTS